jgi:hypothetical protein
MTMLKHIFSVDFSDMKHNMNRLDQFICVPRRFNRVRSRIRMRYCQRVRGGVVSRGIRPDF